MTRDEARLTLQDNFGYLSQEHLRILEALRVALDALSQPPTPSNLDDAAKKIVIQLHPCMEYSSVMGDRLTMGELIELVKAGAEWLAQQGETIGTFIEKITNDEEEFLGILVDVDTFKEGDRVIVQVRKNQ